MPSNRIWFLSLFPCWYSGTSGWYIRDSKADLREPHGHHIIMFYGMTTISKLMNSNYLHTNYVILMWDVLAQFLFQHQPIMLIWLPFVLVIIWSIRIMIVVRGHYSVGHLPMLRLDTTKIWPRPSKSITTHYGQCILPNFYFAKSNIIISQSESSTNLIASLIGISVTNRTVPFIPLVGIISHFVTL